MISPNNSLPRRLSPSKKDQKKKQLIEYNGWLKSRAALPNNEVPLS